jgi:hypothetical protein
MPPVVSRRLNADGLVGLLEHDACACPVLREPLSATSTR